MAKMVSVLLAMALALSLARTGHAVHGNTTFVDPAAALRYENIVDSKLGFMGTIQITRWVQQDLPLSNGLTHYLEFEVIPSSLNAYWQYKYSNSTHQLAGRNIPGITYFDRNAGSLTGTYNWVRVGMEFDAHQTPTLPGQTSASYAYTLKAPQTSRSTAWYTGVVFTNGTYTVIKNGIVLSKGILAPAVFNASWPYANLTQYDLKHGLSRRLSSSGRTLLNHNCNALKDCLVFFGTFSRLQSVYALFGRLYTKLANLVPAGKGYQSFLGNAGQQIAFDLPWFQHAWDGVETNIDEFGYNNTKTGYINCCGFLRGQVSCGAKNPPATPVPPGLEAGRR